MPGTAPANITQQTRREARKQPMIRMIDHHEISRKLEQFEKCRLVDVASLHSYEKYHLPRAIHLPLYDLEAQAEDILPDHGEEIIVYDDGECTSALTAARLLKKLGYSNLFVFEGGREEWVKSGLSTEVYVAQSPAQYNPTFPTVLP